MNRFRFHRRTLTVVCELALSHTIFSAKNIPAPTPDRTTPEARVPSTNIKALPKNITGDEVIKVMHQYEGDLGVECEFCRPQPETRK